MSRRTKIIAAVAALLVVGGAAAAFAFGVGGAAPEVEVTDVQQQDLAVTVAASGRVESGARKDVFPPTAGTLAEVLVEDGATVSEGAIIARIETAPLEAQLSQARAGLAQAESGLTTLDDQEPSGDDLEAARQATTAAWRAYEAALAAQDAVGAAAPSDADADAAAAAANAAWAAYAAARDAYALLAASIEASAAPSPAALAELASAEVARDQAYAGYLQAKAAEEAIADYDPTSSVAQARSGVDQAYAGFLQARAAQRKLEGTSLTAQREAAQAAVDQARKAVAIAEDNLDKADLRAPMDGVVLFNALGTPSADGATPKAQEGAAVGPQSAPFTVVDLDALTFVAEVDEVDIDQIEVGMKGTISLDAFDEPIESAIGEVTPAATLTTTGGTVFPVRLALEGGDADVLIGMKGDVAIEVDSVPGAVTIPVEALFDEGGDTFAYRVASDSTLERVKIEIGTLTETDAEVVSGLSAGDTVALSGPIELVDGMKVRTAK